MNSRSLDRRIKRLEQTTKLRACAFNVEYYEPSLDHELIPRITPTRGVWKAPLANAGCLPIMRDNIDHTRVDTDA
jgi:hypothetical protein